MGSVAGGKSGLAGGQNMKFPLLMTLLGFAFTDPQFPPPGLFYPPLPYGPLSPPPLHFPRPNITTELRSSYPLSPFLLPKSPPYSGPVYSLPPPRSPYLSLAPGYGLPPYPYPQHPLAHPRHPLAHPQHPLAHPLAHPQHQHQQPLSPLAVQPPLSPLVTKATGKSFNDGKYVHDPSGDSFRPYVHDTRGDYRGD